MRPFYQVRDVDVERWFEKRMKFGVLRCLEIWRAERWVLAG